MDEREKEIREIASNKYNLIHSENVRYLLTLIDSLRADHKELREAVGPIMRTLLKMSDLPEWAKILKQAYEKGVK